MKRCMCCKKIAIMKTNISIRFQFYVQLENEKYFISDALLLCEDSEYKIVANIDSKDASKFSFRSKYWNDNMLTLKLHQEFSVKKAFLGDDEIKIKFNNSRLIGIYVEHHIGKKYVTFIWTIDSFAFEFKNNIETLENRDSCCYYLTNASKNILCGKENLSFMYKEDLVTICFDLECNSIYLKTTTRKDYIVNEILSLMSFYLRIPVEIEFVKYVDRNNKRIEFCKVKYQIKEKNTSHFQFQYLKIPNGKSFENFVNSSNESLINDSIFTIIRKGISNYVRSKYLDNTSKFILLSSVLEVYAERIHRYVGDTKYNRIKPLFDHFNIDISKLDSIIKCKNWLDSNGRGIQNFIDLRNEIMHGLPSMEIIEFLDNESDIVSELEFMTCIITLREIGFTDIHFVEGYERINIFNSEN